MTAPTFPKATEPQKACPSFDIGDFIIREKQESDIENFFAYYSNPEVNRFILCQIPQTIEEARTELFYWRNSFYRNDGVYLAIADKKDDRMVGSIGLTSHNPYQKRIELSYDLSPEYWRRGITSRAIDKMTQYAFDELKINRIEASVSIYNEPSKILLLKKGFTLEGTLRQHRYHLGRFVDVYFFSLLKDDLST
jgi:ribosomal-protein-alanine N-acetyltransferase